MCDLQSLEECITSNNGGTQSVLYMIPVDEIDTIPDLGTGTAPGDTKEYQGAFTLVDAGTDYFRKFRLTEKSGNVTDTIVGPDGSKAYRNSIAFGIDGTNAEQLEFGDNLKCPCGFLAIIEDKEGVHRVIGTKRTPAKLTEGEMMTGSSIEEKRGGTFTLTADTGNTAPIYDAEMNPIPTEPTGT